MTTTNKSDIKAGQVGFGQVNNHPPAHWRYEGMRAGAHVLEHVKPASQITGYPDQYVSWEVVERIMRG